MTTSQVSTASGTSSSRGDRRRRAARRGNRSQVVSRPAGRGRRAARRPARSSVAQYAVRHLAWTRWTAAGCRRTDGNGGEPEAAGWIPWPGDRSCAYSEMTPSSPARPRRRRGASAGAGRRDPGARRGPPVRRSPTFEQLRAEQKAMGKQVAQAAGDEKAALLDADQGGRHPGQGGRGRAERGRGGLRASDGADAEPRRTRSPGRRRGRLHRARAHRRAARLRGRGLRAARPRRARQRLGAIDIERGAKVSGARFYYLTGVGADLELALVNMAMDQARDAGFTTMIPPALVKPRAMEGTGFLGQAAGDVYHLPEEDLYLVGTSEVPLAAYHIRRDPRRRDVAAALRRVQPVLPQGGRLLRQGHPGHLPGALVRQGRDVRLHDPRGVVQGARAAARAGRRSGSTSSSWPTGSSTPRPATSVSRRSASSTARRGSRPRASTASSRRRRTARSSRRGGSTSVAAFRGRHPAVGDAQRHAGRDPAHDRRDPRDPPAGRRLGAGARRRCSPTSKDVRRSSPIA